jgi:hypothetical protein
MCGTVAGPISNGCAVAALRVLDATPFESGTPSVPSRMTAPPRADAYVISYPKSGRTWLRLLLAKALSVHYGLAETDLLDTSTLTEAAGLLRTDFVHDETELRADRDYTSLSEDKQVYSDKAVIFLARDPRDVLVSAYFEATRRSFLFDGTPVEFDGSLSEFVRSPVFGVRKLAAFYDIWARSQGTPRRFLLIRYEHLCAQPREVLCEVLRFVGAGAVGQEHVAEAVAYASFANLRSLERANVFHDPRLQPGDPSDPESYKVRRGRVGGYVDYLSQADIAYIDREVALRASPLMRAGPV